MKWPISLFYILILVPCLFAQDKTRETHLELGYVSTSGNTDTQTLSGKVDIKLRGEKNRLFVQSTYLRSENDGEEDANRFTAGIRAERVFSGRLFGFIGLDYLIDRFAGYRHRLSVGPGLGFDILKSEIHKLKGLISGNYVVEDYSVEGVESDGYGSVKGSMNYEWVVRTNVLFKTQISSSVSLENSEKYFLFGEAAVEVAISNRLSLGVGYRINYQSIVPGPDIEKTDMSFMTSLIVNL